MSTESALWVTLVSGHRSTQTTRLAQRLSVGPSRPDPDDTAHDAPLGERSAIDVDTTDSLEFAVGLGDELLDRARAGQRGNVVVAIDPAADPMEVGLMLERHFAAAAIEARVDTEQRDAAQHDAAQIATTPPRASVAVREIVTVVDARDVLDLLFRHRATGSEPGDAEALAAQIEFATAIAVVGAKQMPTPQLNEVLTLLAALNPAAVIMPGHAIEQLRRRRPRRLVATTASRNAGWMRSLAAAPPRSASTGIGQVIFRDPRPFHPERLAAIIACGLEPESVGLIVRSRGFFRLASRVDRVGSWSSAGEIVSLDPTAMLGGDADSPPGQEIVFYGRDLDAARLHDTMAEGLLTGAELLAGPMAWSRYRDPFPAWHADHES